MVIAQGPDECAGVGFSDLAINIPSLRYVFIEDICPEQVKGSRADLLFRAIEAGQLGQGA